MHSLTFVALVGLAASQPATDLKALEDVAKLQGAWTYSSLEVDGKALPSELLGRSKLEITGVHFVHTDGQSTYRGTYKLNVGANPKTIDMTFTEGPEKGNTALGIYEIHGDEWKLCLTLGKQARPTAFATKAGTGYALETLKRNHAARFDGEWIMESGQNDGRPIPDDARKSFRRIVKGDETLVMNGNLVFMRAKFTLDAHKKPKSIDYTLLEGGSKGMKQLGIYEWVEDNLRICFAAPGKERPADFSAGSGSGNTLSVWKRTKP